MKLSNIVSPEYHGYSVKFSPYNPGFLACATSSNYGITGKGALFVYQQIGEEGYLPIFEHESTDGVYDISWSSFNMEILASCTGDGRIQIYNIYNKVPPYVINAHARETSCIDWSPKFSENRLLSSSWDETIRLWDVATGSEIDLFLGHSNIVYGCAWSPHMPGIFGSVGGDKNLRLWDVRATDLLPQKIPAHGSDVLTLDFSTVNEHIVATGGVDNMIKGWDLRNPEEPYFVLVGHESSVRRLKFSPFHRNVMASVSYDFSTRIWDWMCAEQCSCFTDHTEFVFGLDFSYHIPDRMADCSWDCLIHVYDEMDLPVGPPVS